MEVNWISIDTHKGRHRRDMQREHVSVLNNSMIRQMIILNGAARPVPTHFKHLYGPCCFQKAAITVFTFKPDLYRPHVQIRVRPHSNWKNNTSYSTSGAKNLTV